MKFDFVTGLLDYTDGGSGGAGSCETNIDYLFAVDSTTAPILIINLVDDVGDYLYEETL